MDRALRVVALAALLPGLSACNMLVSKEPWFAASEAQPFPAMRDGLWLSAAPDCRVDERKPAERWPDCAGAAFVRGDEQWSMEWNQRADRRRRTFAGWNLAEFGDDALLVANGDHLIVQSRAQDASPTEQADDADAQAAAPVYMYGGLRVLSRDETGKATALAFWNVQCGPVTEPARGRQRRDDPEALDEQHEVTDHPFPGLTVVDDNCTAESVEAVRNAAALSEALEPPTQLRWIREGWH